MKNNRWIIALDLIILCLYANTDPSIFNGAYGLLIFLALMILLGLHYPLFSRDPARAVIHNYVFLFILEVISIYTPVPADEVGKGFIDFLFLLIIVLMNLGMTGYIVYLHKSEKLATARRNRAYYYMIAGSVLFVVWFTIHPHQLF